ncbi:MAG: hypothetical protein MJ182_01620 [Treponema sp.]|nr:hypothetical protein [Treponema sp.]
MKLSLGKTNHRQVCSMLKLIYRNPGINRKQVGESLCIDRAMVTHIYNYLVEQGWLIEQESSLKRLPLVLNHNRIYVAGVELQPEFQVIIVSNIKGEIVFEKQFHEKIMDCKEFCQTKMIPVLESCGYDIFACGLAIPGIVFSEENIVRRSVPFELQSEIVVPKTITINSKEIPLFVENDVRCWGWGRVAFNKETSPFFVFLQHFIDSADNPETFSRITGGSSFFSDAKPCVGSHGCAGEVPGIFRISDFQDMHVPEESRNRMKTNRIFMEKYLKNMAMCISYFSNAFDVNKVYIDGFENMDIDFLKDKIQEYGNQYRFYPELQDFDVVVCENDIRTTALGACGFVLERLIVKPCETESLESLIFPKKAEN